MSAAAKIKFTILGLAAIALFFINKPTQIEKSTEQLRYESWLSGIERIQDTEDGSSQLRALRIELKSNYPELPADWSISAKPDDSGKPKLLRLLQLTREANLFTPDVSLSSDQPALKLDVRTEKQHFSAIFSKNILDSNLPAQSLLKLFEIYSKDQQQSPSISRQ